MIAFLSDLWGRFRPRLLALVALMAVSGATEGLGMVLFLPLISLISGSAGGSALATQVVETLGLSESVDGLALAVIVVFLGQGLVSVAIGWLIADLESSYVDGWRRELLEAILRTRWAYFVQHRVGQILFELNTETERIGRGFLFAAQIAGTVILLAIYLSLSLWLSWQVTLSIMLLGLISFLVVTRGFARRAYQTGASYAQNNSRLLGNLNDFLTSAKLIKVTNSERRVQALSEPLLRSLKRDYFGAIFYHHAHRTVLEIFIVVCICLTLVGMYRLEVTFSSVVVLMAMFLRMLPKLYTAQSSYQMLLGYLPSFEVLRASLERARADAEVAQLDSAAPAFTRPVSVSFRGVTMRYGEVTALRDAHLELAPGKICAIVGPSGAGKSTLVDLLARIVTPDSGEILVDGAPVAALPLASWRCSLGYVTQEPMLLHDTVRNNITWGAPSSGQAEVERAATLANADGFIRSFPEGYETVVGERGTRLSGGQRQRIALARALLNRPAVLILDEPSSALDHESEQAILQALTQLRGETTILLISHSLASVRIADQVVLLEGGSIVETGTWEELKERGGAFASLWNRQQVAFGE